MGIPFGAGHLRRVSWADDSIVAVGPAQLRRMLMKVDDPFPEAGMSADWTESGA